MRVRPAVAASSSHVSAHRHLCILHRALPGIAKDGPQLGTAKTAKVFNRNFFTDFTAVLGKHHTIQKFELCDFEVRGCMGVGGMAMRS